MPYAATFELKRGRPLKDAEAKSLTTGDRVWVQVKRPGEKRAFVSGSGTVSRLWLDDPTCDIRVLTDTGRIAVILREGNASDVCPEGAIQLFKLRGET